MEGKIMKKIELNSEFLDNKQLTTYIISFFIFFQF